MSFKNFGDLQVRLRQFYMQATELVSYHKIKNIIAIKIQLKNVSSVDRLGHMFGDGCDYKENIMYVLVFPIIFINICFQCDPRSMKVKKLGKDENIPETENAKKVEKEVHWLPQTAIQDTKNTSKPRLTKGEIAKKRIDRRKYIPPFFVVALCIGRDLD
jgi:hypothetical protein